MPEENSNILVGYDTNGLVFDQGDSVLRKVSPDYHERAAKLFEAYLSENLESLGLVETTFNKADSSFTHKKHLISYPFEWTANMYKDAVLFQLNLLKNLEPKGLTLKDALPNNIVFQGTNPVFVDFLSLVQSKDLEDENWLKNRGTSDLRLSVIRHLFEPFMLVPLITMSFGKFEEAREMLSTRSCNTPGTRPSWHEVVEFINGGNISRRLYYKTRASILMYRLYFKLATYKILSYSKVLNWLIRFVEKMDVTPQLSAYSKYYEEKEEDNQIESDLLPKQATIRDILNNIKPNTVMDIGANTGWYSRLACKSGARVISLEIDESCVDIIYKSARSRKLEIVPLKMTFDELEREIHGVKQNGSDIREGDQTAPLLYGSGISRFRADAVLVLGLAHHLVLGLGHSIEHMYNVLAPMVLKTLIIEFVDLKDSKVIEEPDFFANLDSFNEQSYNLDVFIEKGKAHFSECEILPSNPDTRKILIFTK